MDGIVFANVGVLHFAGFLSRSRETVRKQDRGGKVVVFKVCSGKLKVP